MSDALKLIESVLAEHYPSIDNEVGSEPYWCGDHEGCGTWNKSTQPRWRQHLAAEVDKALGGLTRAWAAVLPDDSYFGPYHEAYEISRNEARMQAEADVAEYEDEDAELKSRWVSGWSEATND